MDKFSFLEQDYPDLYDLYIDIRKFQMNEPDLAVVKTRQFIECLFSVLNCQRPTIDHSVLILDKIYDFNLNHSFKLSLEYVVKILKVNYFYYNKASDIDFDVLLKKLLDISVWFIVEAKREKYDYRIFPIEYQKDIFDYQFKRQKNIISSNIIKIINDSRLLYYHNNFDAVIKNINTINDRVGLLNKQYLNFKEKEYSLLELETFHQKGRKFLALENYREAYEQYLQLSLLGHAPSQTDLAYMFFDGIYVNKDIEKGLHWLLKAVNQNYRKAIDELEEMILSEDYFFCLYNGLEMKIAKSLERIALKGNADDVFIVGFLYSKSIGFEYDAEKELIWYKHAACLNSIDAIIKLIEIYKSDKKMNWL